MGRQPKVQNKLFYTALNLEQRVRQDHILRKVKRNIDFDFIYNEVKDTYGINGNESVAPPIILKMMRLLIFYNVRSERELALTIPERLDWLWFLEYDIDDDIPNHSVLSKARARWVLKRLKPSLNASSGSVCKPALLTAARYLWIRAWCRPMPPIILW